MRVFFLTYAYEPGLGADAGGFRKLWELAAALDATGHDVRVFYPRLPGFAPLREVPAEGYPAVDRPLLRPLSAYLAMLGSALRAGRRGRPDVVYFRSGTNVLPLAAARLLGARAVLEVNADAGQFLRQEGAPRWRRRLFGAAEALNARRSDLVVAVTPGLKQMVVERYGVPAERVRVIPSGTDPRHFTPADPGPARIARGLPADAPLVGFAGLLYRHQGVDTLIRALPRLRERVAGVRALVVGDGVMRGPWERLAREMGVAGAARFTGQVPYRDVPGWFAAMDVVTAPLTADRGETSPFKVLDALACARPAVASDLGSLRALAEASGAVTLVPPGDPDALAEALARLLGDPATRRAAGLAGRSYVLRHHAWECLGAELAAALSSAAGPEPALAMERR